MKLELANVKWMAVLAVVAGCATELENKTPEPAQPVAEKKAEAAADPYKAEMEKCRKAVLGWSMHSQPVEIAKNLPDVAAFIERHRDDPKCAGDVELLTRNLIKSYWRCRDMKTGTALAERAFADEKSSFALRLEAAHYLAMKAVDERKDYAAADAYYAKLAAQKPENVFSRPNIAGHRAYLYTLRDDKAGAIRFLESERAALDERDTLGRGLYDDAIADVYGDFFDYAGKLAFWKDRGNKYKAFKVLTSGDVSDLPQCAQIARELVASDPNVSTRREAWMWLWGYDTPFCRANLAAALGDTAATTNAFCNALAGKFTISNSHCPQLGHSPAWDMDWPCVAETWELYREIGRKAGVVPTFDSAQYAAIAYAGLRQKAKAAAAAREGLANENLKPEERYELALMAEVVGLSGDEKAMVGKLAAAEAALAKDCPAGERQKRFGRAGGLATLSCDDALAHAVAAYYREYMDPVKPRKRYTVKFTDRAVAGAGDWANIPFKPDESDFDRKFGGPGMAFMTTDVATGDRGNAVKGGAKAREFPTTLQAVADEWGIHFLYTFYDTRARQFESGELDAGSFESYVAAGENQPYACFLCPLKKRARVGVMNTTYDMPGHRRIDVTDPQRVRSETLFTDDAALHYTAFSWDLFAEHVPTDGGEWDFESVFWGPVQSAWNGTASIHGRSTWGLLRFELGEAARVKILRAQLFRAVAEYKAEKSPGALFATAAQEGVFDHWQDDGVGDPEFYDACLKPMVEELDAAAARVKVGMSDADVKEISEKYLSRFLNVRFEVSRLRTDYLRNRL